jgi:O-antigen/teichoic acid export membrane protein
MQLAVASRPPQISITRHTLLYGLANAVSKGLAVLTVPFLSRSLGPANYGLADLASSLAALLTLIVLFAGDIPAARLSGGAKVEERGSVYRSYVFAVAVGSMAGVILLMPASGAIAKALWGAQHDQSLVMMGLFLVPVSALQVAFITIQRLEGHAAAYAGLALIDLLAQLGAAVLLVALGYGPIGVVGGYLLGSCIGLAAAVLAAPKLGGKVVSALVIGLVRGGLPFLPTVVLFVISDYVARSAVALHLGPAAVGNVGVALRVASVLGLISTAFALAFGPIGIRLTPGREAAQIVADLFDGFVIVASGLALVVALLAPEIVNFVAGPQYHGAGSVLPVMTVGAVAAGAHYVLSIAAGIRQKSPIVAASATVGATVQILASYALVSSIGIAGAAVSMMVGRLVCVLALLPAVRGYFGIRGLATLLGLAGATSVLMLVAVDEVTIVLRVCLALVSLAVASLAAWGALSRTQIRLW